MSVIPLTVFFSLFLVGTFVVLFMREQSRRHLTSPERDSLLPLADEIARSVTVESDDHDHDHDYHQSGDHACGCRNGRRAPCVGCLKRRDAADPTHF